MQVTSACFAPGVAGLLSPLRDFLDDTQVSEILINKPQEVFIERNGSLLRFDLPVLTPLFLRRLFMLIANDNKQILSETFPILSGNLADGSRVQLVIPQASQYETLSIRKFTLQQLSFENYADRGFFNNTHGVTLNKTAHTTQTREDTEQLLQRLYREKHWPAFLRQAILAKKNIIISGATSSGKTTFINHYRLKAIVCQAG